MLLSKEFHFEASHQLSNHPGKCARLHGHSWLLTVFVIGAVDPETGMVMDYGDLKSAVQPIVDCLDHTHLGSGYVKSDTNGIVWLGPSHNPTLPILPTSENLLIWIAQQLPSTFPWATLKLNETCTSAAILTREEYDHLYAFHQETEERQDQETATGVQGTEAKQDVEQDVEQTFTEAVTQTEISDDDIPF